MSGLELLGAILGLSVVLIAILIAWMSNQPGYRRRRPPSDHDSYRGPNRRAGPDSPDLFDQPLFSFLVNKENDKIEKQSNETSVEVVRKE